MFREKSKKKTSRASLARVRKAMKKARMARSANVAELKLDTALVPVQANTTLARAVAKIIRSAGPSKPEKAQVAVDSCDRGYRDLPIENALADEQGDDGKLKKDARVNLIVRENQRE
jgi:hypothetical protein